MTHPCLVAIIYVLFLCIIFSYLLQELMDNYKKEEENDIQNKTGVDQGGFIELSSRHKNQKENVKSGCCS